MVIVHVMKSVPSGTVPDLHVYAGDAREPFVEWGLPMRRDIHDRIDIRLGPVESPLKKQKASSRQDPP